MAFNSTNRRNCTDPNGLEHPFIAPYDGRLHLWATRGLGTEIVTAQLDSSGRCDLIKGHSTVMSIAFLSLSV